MKQRSSQRGTTLIELLIVVSIIAVLARVIFPVMSEVREKADLSKALIELKSIHNSLVQYRSEYGEYPDDTNRSIPPGLEEFLAPGVWPGSAWPDSVLDWDNWADPDSPGDRIMQISIRFCPIGQPAECKFPKADWAQNFDINSSVYYCVEGACRAHIARPINHPGYCVNC